MKIFRSNYSIWQGQEGAKRKSSAPVPKSKPGRLTGNFILQKPAGVLEIDLWLLPVGDIIITIGLAEVVDFTAQFCSAIVVGYSDYIEKDIPLPVVSKKVLYRRILLRSIIEIAIMLSDRSSPYDVSIILLEFLVGAEHDVQILGKIWSQRSICEECRSQENKKEDCDYSFHDPSISRIDDYGIGHSTHRQLSSIISSSPTSMPTAQRKKIPSMVKC